MFNAVKWRKERFHEFKFSAKFIFQVVFFTFTVSKPIYGDGRSLPNFSKSMSNTVNVLLPIFNLHIQTYSEFQKRFKISVISKIV